MLTVQTAIGSLPELCTEEKMFEVQKNKSRKKEEKTCFQQG